MKWHSRNADDPRETMIEEHLIARGIADQQVLEAMRLVRRELFVAERFGENAYADRPLPIEADQTISQPFIVALMAEAAELTPTDRVLEIGAGSGYGAAVLSRLAGHVWTIERHTVLAEMARGRLEALDYANVTVVHGDGSGGLPDEAPFDAIVVTAAAAEVPAALVDQLAEGGRLIIPVGTTDGAQQLLRIRRAGDGTTTEDLGGVRFVPLITG